MGSDGELQTGATQERGIHMQDDQIASAGLGRNEPQQIQQAPMGLPKENPGLFFLPTDKSLGRRQTMCIYRQTTITIFFLLLLLLVLLPLSCVFLLMFFRATILFVFGLVNVTEIGI